MAVLALPLGAHAASPGNPRMAGTAKLAQMGYPEIEGWEADDHLTAFRTFLVSCERLLKLAGERPGRKLRPGADLARACTAALRLPATLDRSGARAFFEANFTPYAVLHAARPGLLTGYYEPILKGSRSRQGRYQFPIYRRPPELVTVSDDTKGPKRAAMSHGRRTAEGLRPFYTRAEIEQGALTGRDLELVFLEDPVDVFFMHIQGSARIQLEDGSFVRVGYDGKNGHPYASIGRYVIEQGLMAADKVSLDSLRVWLSQDRKRGQQVMWQNPSFIFFREMGEDADKGPLGALGVPLTAGRSVAVDTAYHALGTPIFVTGRDMTHVQPSGTFARLMIAQDVGSAIKGPERADVYFGSGDEAGKVAGVTRHRGHFVVLVANAADGHTSSTGKVP